MKHIVHKPVMMAEVLHYLAPEPGKHIIDGTVGQGGHALQIMTLVLPDGRFLGIDRDTANLSVAKDRLNAFSKQSILVQGSYADAKSLAALNGFAGVNGILLDLGFSSAHIEEADRGFSFDREGPLDMRYDRTQGPTAKEIVNTWSAEELAKCFRHYGEEPQARQIAEAIVRARKKHPIETTVELADVVVSVMGKRGRVHPATRVFQALRIATNDELTHLENALPDLVDMLSTGGRLVIISFHSLEDRIVKQFFKEKNGQTLTVLTKRAVKPTQKEIKENPRARSAVLRAAEKLPL